MKNRKLKLNNGQVLFVLIGTFLVANVAMAAVAAGTIAPWEGVLCSLSDMLRGKTAFAIATIAFVAAAAGFVFGEQLSGIMKTVVNIFIAIGLMLGSSAAVGGIALAVSGGQVAC